jgi:hypothetical protein
VFTGGGFAVAWQVVAFNGEEASTRAYCEKLDGAEKVGTNAGYGIARGVGGFRVLDCCRVGYMVHDVLRIPKDSFGKAVWPFL